MTTTTNPTNTTTGPTGSGVGTLPARQSPFDHDGLCYDQIGAIAVAGGFTAAVAAGALASGVAALFTAPESISWVDFVPDPAAVGGAAGLTCLATGALFLGRHWRRHQAGQIAQNERLLGNHDDPIVAGGPGEIDPQALPGVGVITEADLATVADPINPDRPVDPAGTTGPISTGKFIAAAAVGALAAGVAALLSAPERIDWADFIPDPVVGGATGLTCLATAALLLYRRWQRRRHQAEQIAHNERLLAQYDDLIAGLQAGEIDVQALLDAGVITAADLAAVAADEPSTPGPAGDEPAPAGDGVAGDCHDTARPLALVAAAGEED